MARSRKMPPLFEVMRETDRRPEEGRTPATPGTILPRPTEPVAVPARREPARSLRLSEDDHGPAPSASPEIPDESSGSVPGGKVAVPLPVLLTSVGILIGVVALIAVLAFRAGAKKERDQLLTGDSDPPVVAPEKGPGSTPENVQAAPGPAKPVAGDAPKSAPRATPSKAVFGDDPREVGKNYLIVERLSFDDAVAAAQFLTDNGVASVVVAPEGTDPSELAKQPRGLWQVITRTGFTRDEFRASDTRVSDLKKEVIRLGRRWKQDHKGSSDFTNCLWDKFGK